PPSPTIWTAIAGGIRSGLRNDRGETGLKVPWLPMKCIWDLGCEPRTIAISPTTSSRTAFFLMSSGWGIRTWSCSLSWNIPLMVLGDIKSLVILLQPAALELQRNSWLLWIVAIKRGSVCCWIGYPLISQGTATAWDTLMVPTCTSTPTQD